MPFPKKAQQRGGSKPATESQKAAAQAWAIAHQPWLKSTGPKSWEGKHTSSTNAIQATYTRRVESWNEDFEVGCQDAEAAIAALKKMFNESPILGSITVVRRFSNKDEQRWACFFVKIKRTQQLELPPSALAAQQLWQSRTITT